MKCFQFRRFGRFQLPLSVKEWFIIRWWRPLKAAETSELKKFHWLVWTKYKNICCTVYTEDVHMYCCRLAASGAGCAGHVAALSKDDYRQDSVLVSPALHSWGCVWQWQQATFTSESVPLVYTHIWSDHVIFARQIDSTVSLTPPSTL